VYKLAKELPAYHMEMLQGHSDVLLRLCPVPGGMG